MPALSGLSKAWVEAEAARPDGWELLGVAKGPRELDLHIASAEWVAWARDPDGERVDGRGESPEQALDDFTNVMRKSGQAFKVE